MAAAHDCAQPMSAPPMPRHASSRVAARCSRDGRFVALPAATTDGMGYDAAADAVALQTTIAVAVSITGPTDGHVRRGRGRRDRGGH